MAVVCHDGQLCMHSLVMLLELQIKVMQCQNHMVVLFADSVEDALAAFVKDTDVDMLLCLDGNTVLDVTHLVQVLNGPDLCLLLHPLPVIDWQSVVQHASLRTDFPLEQAGIKFNIDLAQTAPAAQPGFRYVPHGSTVVLKNFKMSRAVLQDGLGAWTKGTHVYVGEAAHVFGPREHIGRLADRCHSSQLR